MVITVKVPSDLLYYLFRITTFSTASHQMIKAQTSQLVTAWNLNPKHLTQYLKPNPQRNSISIGNFSITQKPLTPGQFIVRKC